MTKRNNEALYRYQQQLRRYCDKEMISTTHLARIMSILCKAWGKATEIGFEEGRKQNEPNVWLHDMILNGAKESDGVWKVPDKSDFEKIYEELKNLSNDQREKELQRRKFQYHLSCKKCGKAYWCAIAYPVDQLCEECIGENNNISNIK